MSVKNRFSSRHEGNYAIKHALRNERYLDAQGR